MTDRRPRCASFHCAGPYTQPPPLARAVPVSWHLLRARVSGLLPGVNLALVVQSGNEKKRETPCFVILVCCCRALARCYRACWQTPWLGGGLSPRRPCAKPWRACRCSARLSRWRSCPPRRPKACSSHCCAAASARPPTARPPSLPASRTMMSFPASRVSSRSSVSQVSLFWGRAQARQGTAPLFSSFRLGRP